MSIKSNKILGFLKEVETLFRSTDIRRKNLVLSTEQHLLVVDALVLFTACWYDLLSSNGHETTGLHPRWTMFIRDLDLVDLIGCCKEADSLLLTMACSSVSSFKHSLKTTCPRAGQFIAPLRGLLDAWFSKENINAFSALHNCFVFMSRLNLPGLTDLQDEALSSFLEQELKLRDFPYKDEKSSEEAKVLSKWFPRESKNVLFGARKAPDRVQRLRQSPFSGWPDHRASRYSWNPKHGPGSIAEAKVSLSEKYKLLGQDEWTRFLDNQLPESELTLPRTRLPFRRESKVVFVPKSVDKLRTICMEPATLMWYQQGFGKNVVSYIERHRYLSKRINLEHQEYNKQLAWFGSTNGGLSTIDLSAASDSVAYSMVKDLFYKTSLIEILMATRSSRSLLPDGTVIENLKFAPMGSNLCFPVESILFASIVEASIARSGDSVHSSMYRVYGDDIVIETRYVDAVVTRLSELGFVVNSAKSFTSTQPPYFRESCGGEFINGVDVTPVRLSRRFSGLDCSDRSHPSRILGIVDICNASFMNLPSVRRWSIEKLSELPIGYRVRFDEDGTTGVKSCTPTNHHLGPAIYNSDLQEWYCRCGTIRSRRSGPLDRSDEDIRLYECLRTINGRQALVFPEDLVTTEIRANEGSFWARSNTLSPEHTYHADLKAW